jgi:hypothetical protein
VVELEDARVEIALDGDVPTGASPSHVELEKGAARAVFVDPERGLVSCALV